MKQSAFWTEVLKQLHTNGTPLKVDANPTTLFPRRERVLRIAGRVFNQLGFRYNAAALDRSDAKGFVRFIGGCARWLAPSRHPDELRIARAYVMTRISEALQERVSHAPPFTTFRFHQLGQALERDLAAAKDDRSYHRVLERCFALNREHVVATGRTKFQFLPATISQRDYLERMRKKFDLGRFKRAMLGRHVQTGCVVHTDHVIQNLLVTFTERERRQEDRIKQVKQLVNELAGDGHGVVGSALTKAGDEIMFGKVINS